MSIEIAKLIVKTIQWKQIKIIAFNSGNISLSYSNVIWLTWGKSSDTLLFMWPETTKNMESTMHDHLQSVLVLITNTKCLQNWYSKPGEFYYLNEFRKARHMYSAAQK